MCGACEERTLNILSLISFTLFLYFCLIIMKARLDMYNDDVYLVQVYESSFKTNSAQSIETRYTMCVAERASLTTMAALDNYSRLAKAGLEALCSGRG